MTRGPLLDILNNAKIGPITINWTQPWIVYVNCCIQLGLLRQVGSNYIGGTYEIQAALTEYGEATLSALKDKDRLGYLDTLTEVDDNGERYLYLGSMSNLRGLADIKEQST